jgi:thiamine biosynthesis lipoprotein
MAIPVILHGREAGWKVCWHKESESLMKISHLSACLLAGAATVAVPMSRARAAESWAFHDDHVLGTSFDIIVVAMDQKGAALAAAFAQAEIRRLDTILSGWRNDSELARLNASSMFAASQDLYRVIAACEEWRMRTQGAFSARLGQIEGLLQQDAASSAGALAQNITRAIVAMDPEGRSIERPGEVTFAIDGLAKGYIIDRALEAARSIPGVQGVMVDIGGDLRCWGAAPGGSGWRIGVAASPSSADNAAPATILNLTNKAVATSGLGPRGATIMDPATGLRADKIVMATAVAELAADADALASAFSVMKPEDSVALADSLPGVAARIVTADGQTLSSQRWAGMMVADADGKTAPAPMRLAQAQTTWPAGNAVTVDYQIPDMPGSRRPHNPYVTIWVTNETGKVVRTLIYLAGKRRYLDENFVFWEQVGAAHPDLVESVTKPTRPPGQYSLQWDGRDDQGKPVPQGKYVLNIEAAREHAGHNIQHIEMTLGSQPFTAEAAAAGELGAARVRYGSNP